VQLVGVMCAAVPGREGEVISAAEVTGAPESLIEVELMKDDPGLEICFSSPGGDSVTPAQA